MLLNLKVIFKILNVPEFPVHQHNLHVPECLCNADAPENENDLTVMFFPEYQCFCIECKTVPECSWISEISVFLNVNVNMKVIFKIPSILEFYLISAQLLCSSVSENSV